MKKRTAKEVNDAIMVAEKRLAQLQRQNAGEEETLERRQAEWKVSLKALNDEYTRVDGLRQKTEAELATLKETIKREQRRLEIADAFSVLLGAFYEAGFEALKRSTFGYQPRY